MLLTKVELGCALDVIARHGLELQYIHQRPARAEYRPGSHDRGSGVRPERPGISGHGRGRRAEDLACVTGETMLQRETIGSPRDQAGGPAQPARALRAPAGVRRRRCTLAGRGFDELCRALAHCGHAVVLLDMSGEALRAAGGSLPGELCRSGRRDARIRRGRRSARCGPARRGGDARAAGL